MLLFVAIVACAARGDERAAAREPLPGEVRKITMRVSDDREIGRALGRALSARLREVNADNSKAWKDITSRDEWEAFRRERLAALRQSLKIPEKRPPVKIHVASERAGDGYRVQNLIYETRERFFVTANLYLPAKIPDSMPGILLSHSHHSPKWQGELQDMGMTWARAGCAVLVPDHLGHGERRQHPFRSADDFERSFAVGRQDYYFRYDLGMQLHLAGESLMGWLAWDLMAGVDVLLAQERIDPRRIILFGGVAGGGDPAAVTGALDERIACVGPFNFGGPQPETRYPLPDDAETWFNYAGSGSWESTRNLTGSADGLGFQPWVIVGSVAPRKLIYGHEFAWDGERDPVWKRLQTIWGFYGEADEVAVAHGRGTLQGEAPASSHCGNIGAFHRRMIHPLLERWFAIHASPESEFSARLPASELTCWTDELRAKLQPRAARELLAEKVVSASAEPAAKSDSVRQALVATEVKETQQTFDGFVASKVQLGERAAYVLLVPQGHKGKLPYVVALSPHGKEAFRDAQAEEIARLLEAGVAVCLIDVRGVGELAPDTGRGPQTALTSYSSTALMLGEPLPAMQHADLQLVLDRLRESPGLDRERFALWAESLTPGLAADAPFQYPWRVDRPREAEPIGMWLVLQLAQGEVKPRAVYAHGGLTSFASTLESPFVQIPHDAVIPGVLLGHDLPASAAKLAPLPLRLEGLVDGRNRLCTRERLERDYAATRAAYAQASAAEAFTIAAERSSPAAFLLQHLAK